MNWIRAFVAVMFSVLPLSGTELVRQESLPPQPTAGYTVIDLWTFYCPAGGSATISVDTLAVGAATTSPLDPYVNVFDDDGYALAFADDEMTCTVSSACGYECPQTAFNCVEGGEVSILVSTWASGASGCSDAEGYYLLWLEVFDGPDQSGASLPANAVRLGGQEPSRGYGWGYLLAGPAADDAAFEVAPSLTGVDRSSAPLLPVTPSDKDLKD